MKSKRAHLRGRARIKVMSAAVGASAVVVMTGAALTGSGNEVSAGTAVGIGTEEATLGETSTETGAPTTLETSVATPTVTATTSEGEAVPPGPQEYP